MYYNILNFYKHMQTFVPCWAQVMSEAECFALKDFYYGH